MTKYMRIIGDDGGEPIGTIVEYIRTEKDGDLLYRAIPGGEWDGCQFVAGPTNVEWVDGPADTVDPVIAAVTDQPIEPKGFSLVTIKLPRNPNHDPHNKVTGPCPVSRVCTDSTGEHHTVLVETDAEVEELRAQFKHITRIEKVASK